MCSSDLVGQVILRLDARKIGIDMLRILSAGIVFILDVTANLWPALAHVCTPIETLMQF